MRKWLGRSAYALIILAAWQFMEGRLAREKGRDPTWHYVAAGVIFGCGAAAMRERYRPEDPQDPGDPSS